MSEAEVICLEIWKPLCLPPSPPSPSPLMPCQVLLTTVELEGRWKWITVPFNDINQPAWFYPSRGSLTPPPSPPGLSGLQSQALCLSSATATSPTPAPLLGFPVSNRRHCASLRPLPHLQFPGQTHRVTTPADDSRAAYQAAIDAFQVQKLDCYLLPCLLDLGPPDLQHLLGVACKLPMLQSLASKLIQEGSAAWTIVPVYMDCWREESPWH